MTIATWNDAVIAESEHTTVVEGNHYFPIGDVRTVLLVDSPTTSHCPWKGDASYFNVVVNGETNPDAAFIYKQPKPEAAQISEHVAFWHGIKITDH